MVKAVLSDLLVCNKLKNVQLHPVSTPEKRRRGANEWIATPPRAKKTCVTLIPLKWFVDHDAVGSETE